MKLKRTLALLLAFVMVLSLAACAGNEDSASGDSASTSTGDSASGSAEDSASGSAGDSAEDSATAITVAAIETAYGTQMWTDVTAAFTAETGIEVNLITDANLEDVISASMQGGEFPDVVHLATGRPAGLTEQFIKDQAIAEITDVLSMTVPGESVKVSDKIPAASPRPL